jgi:DNA invertase Pin-like site-specific DNA recombinase
LREFVSRKVTLIIPGAFDTSRMGRVFPQMLDAIEEFKHSVTAGAIREGLSAARRRGVKLGRPMSRNAHHEDVARLRARGMTGRAIGRELGIPSSTAFKIISQLH